MVGREDKRTNHRTMFPTLKDNEAAGDKGAALSNLTILNENIHGHTLQMINYYHN